MVLDESGEKMLAELRRKRGVVKASLTRVRTFVTRFNPREDAITLLEFRQEELPHINRRFDDVQGQIELVDPGNTEECERERESFENIYYKTRSEIQEIINMEKSLNSSLHNASDSTNIVVRRSQLAPIALPKFNGDILEWESFFDIFKVLVHNDDMYSAAQKFSYLHSTLSGQALDVVKGIPMTEANYKVAIMKLQQRYDNKSLVIQSHIRKILDCPGVKTSTSRELQGLYSLVSTHVSALEALGQPVKFWDAWLVTIVLRKLDSATLHAWQTRQVGTDLPKFSDLEEFISGRCIALQGAETWTTKAEVTEEDTTRRSATGKKAYSPSTPKRVLLISRESTEERCVCCSEEHRLFICPKFKGMSVPNRLTLVREARCCFNCLAPYHMAGKCRSRYRCSKCNRTYNTLLHLEDKEVPVVNRIEGIPVGSKSPGGSQIQEEITKSALVVNHAGGHVFLATAVVSLTDIYGVERNCRTILDCGSQVNFISKRFAALLRVPHNRTLLPVNGIGSSCVQSAASVSVGVKSLVNRFEIVLQCHVLPVIINSLPSCTRPAQGWKIPERLMPQLADPLFDSAGPVDLLIGNGVFFDLLEGDHVSLGSGSLSLQETKFGWVVVGEAAVTSLVSIGRTIEEDWKATLPEEGNYARGSTANCRCLEEEKAAQHFQETVARSKQGRFVLRLPIKTDAKQLGDSVAIAASRFTGIEKRLLRDIQLCTEYRKFMNDYIEMGHMQEVPRELVVPRRVCYLPHHAVFKTTSLTSKVRVVFDASAKTSSGVALNDILMRGPTVQADIFSILCRFRKYQIVITADIEKMFRQIAVAEEDWDLQRIFWRDDPKEALRSYHLCTVTYGTTPASFMATQCLVTLAEQFKHKWPEAAARVHDDFYMDDLMTGGETEQECCQLQKEIAAILDSAKLPLRKWCSNSQAVRERIGTRGNDPLFSLNIGEDDTVKSLGLGWKPVTDDFQFNVIPLPVRSKLTKRALLSDLNKVFDPLGFLGPVLIKGKIFIQQLWQLKVDWDAPLSEDIQEKWKKNYAEFQELGRLSIPRKSQPSKSKVIEIHGFCDASVEAYGAAIYVRTLDIDGTWHSRLLCSKSRIAPLKGATIPRLELSGALLLAQLEKVAFSWGIVVHDFRCWTDSMGVLAWLNSRHSRLKTFVANRVCQILEITSVDQWNHVQTEDNPADILSRGTTTGILNGEDAWWHGPAWLTRTSDEWKRAPKLLLDEESLPERRPVKFALVVVESSSDLLGSYSDWRRLVRAAAWLRKFVDFLRNKGAKGKTSERLTVADIRQAENSLIRRAQIEEFGKELHALEKGMDISGRSKLKSLCPTIREDKVLVVGGRLDNSLVSELRKHPIVLPGTHRITRLIFKDSHRSLLHCGPQSLLAQVRRKYWPIRGRVMARSVTTR